MSHCHRDYSDTLMSQIVKFLGLIASKNLAEDYFTDIFNFCSIKLVGMHGDTW